MSDYESVVAGFRQIGEKLAHGGSRLEVVLRCQPAAVRILDMSALLDAEQHVVGLVHRGLGKMDVVGRDQRQTALVGQINEWILDAALDLLTVPLQLQVKPAVEELLQPLQHVSCSRGLPGREQSADAAADAARYRQEAFGFPFEIRQMKARDRADLEFEVSAAHQPHQVEIALLVLDQESQPVDREQLARGRDAALFLAANTEVAPDDRLNARFGGILREFEGAEEIVAVRNRDSRHGLRLGERHDGVDLVRTFGERIGGTDFEMDEIGDGHPPSSPSILWKVRRSARHL